jgi:RNA polymerase sporulation-specific sigma factor
MKRYIRDNTSIRISRGIKDNAYMILKYKEEYLKKYNKEASIDDIKSNLNLNEYDIRLALDSLKDVMSLYEPIYNDSGDTIYLCDQIADTNDDKDSLIALKRALEHIKLRERQVLENRYIYGMTQSEIADDLSISQAQVSRIEKSAILKLKKLIE